MFCIIEALANPEKERMKQADANLSNWLQSLSKFCGAICKKYPVEITALLQLIANQMKAGKSIDLLVLKDLVQKMTGIESNDDITPQQLEALAGGELLKAEGAYFGQIRNIRKPSVRLRDALMEGHLTIPLCLLIAQQRNGVVYVEETTDHLKLLGKLYDQCQDNLIQFGGFLTLQLGTHNYQETLPSLDELHRFAISPDVSFFLTRPIYKHQITSRISSVRQSLSENPEKTYKQKQQDFEKKFAETCDDIFRPVVEAVIPLQSSKMWNNLSPLLYVSFWSLSMYDLYSPVERYDLEITKLQNIVNDLEGSKETSSKKRKEKERCQAMMGKLQEEMQLQFEHNKLIKKWLETRKDAWFPSQVAKGETITQFIQLCVFPRCVFSPIDAVYCAKFIQTIHTLQAPNFSTLICFDRIFSDISYIVASFTENEASRYGRFLHQMLQMVMRWHGNKKLYDDECAKYPGFVTLLRATNTGKASYLDYENFRHVCHKWQYKITKAAVVCLESTDFTQIRNTIIVLIKILPFYPQVKNLGQAVERRVEKIIEEEKEKRKDLHIMAVGYNGMLKKKSDMVPENQFHLKEKEKSESSKSAAAKDESTSAKVESKPRPDKPDKQLEKTQPTKIENNPSDGEQEKLKSISKERKEAIVLSDNRSNSPQSEQEDSKKRKGEEEGFSSPSLKLKESGSKDKTKSERKRMSVDQDGKESKRKREDVLDNDSLTSEPKPKKDKEKKSKKEVSINKSEKTSKVKAVKSEKTSKVKAVKSEKTSKVKAVKAEKTSKVKAVKAEK
jgi:THO complex subunit 2